MNMEKEFVIKPEFWDDWNTYNWDDAVVSGGVIYDLSYEWDIPFDTLLSQCDDLDVVAGLTATTYRLDGKTEDAKKLCYLAQMAYEWDSSASDAERLEILEKAADILRVDVGLSHDEEDM